MIKEGLLKKYGIEVMFGLHISSSLDAGNLNFKTEGTLAAADRLYIKVKGKQSHGSRPWAGVDPIVTSAQIIMGLQTIISRQTDLTKEAAVITIGQINSGVRNNIIPEEAEMIGTIRTLDTTMQKIIWDKIKKTAEAIAESQGAIAEVEITPYTPVTYNDPKLAAKMLPSLEKTAGENNVRVTVASTGAEDFAFYAKEIPSFFYGLGGKDPKADDLQVFPHHTPDFYVVEDGLTLGVRSQCNLVFDYIKQSKSKNNRP
jgi:amidohydrolase